MKTYADYGIDLPAFGTGNRNVTCPKCSQDRTKKRSTCLSVDMDKGVWNCHHCGWAGRLEFTDQEKAEYAAQQKAARTAARQETRPPELSDLTPAAVKWLEARGISAGTARAMAVKSASVYFAKLGRVAAALAIPFMKDGETVNWKYRCIEVKDFSQQKGGQQCLYAWDDAAGQNTVILTEGELDALALLEVDYMGACSCPNGAPPEKAASIDGKLAFIDEARDAVFGPAERVLLAMDADGPGIQFRDAIADRIGREKCYTVTYPVGCKDANDVLVKQGRDALRNCIENATPYPVSGLTDFTDNQTEIREHFRSGGQRRGLSTGWPRLDEFFRLASGTLNIVTGIPSSGKSEWLDQLLLNAARLHDWRWAVFSPENLPPALHFQKLAEKHTGKPMFRRYAQESMTESEVTAAIEYLSDRTKFITIDERGLTVDDILGKVKVCVARHRVNGFILDPYNEIEHCRPAGMSETEYISLF